MTTAERLREVVEQVNRTGLVELLAPLDEATRAGLAPIAANAFAEAKRQHDALLYGHVPDAGDLAEAQQWSERMQTAALAWLGTGDFAEFPPPRDYGHSKWYEHFDFARVFGTDELHQILVDRRPAWLAELAAQYFTDHHWDSAWRLVVEGVLPRPAGATYLYGMADHAAWQPEPGLPAMVRRDPALLQVDLPALLELPDGLSRMIARDTQPARYWDGQAWVDRGRTWLPILNAHFPPGHPIRDRILDRVLDLLSGDVGGRDAARFRTFLDGLAPTPDELAARRRALYALVAHRLPAVVGYTIRMVTRLNRAKLVPPAELIDAVEPALLTPAKSTAIAALAVAASALRRDRTLERRALEEFATAAAHPHPEVQVAAIEAAAPLLAAYPDIAARLGDLLPELSPTAAERLRAALPQQPAADVVVPDSDLEDLIRRAEKIPPEVAHAHGLDAALKAVRRQAEPPAVPVRPWSSAHDAAVRPVSSVDELIEVLLCVVNERGTVLDLERALDGLARIGSRWPSGFNRRVGPLLTSVKRRWEDFSDWGERPGADMCLLVASWIEPERGGGPEHQATRPYAWLAGRIREVALGLGDPDPQPLLALPTHCRGWIDPAVLVDRARAAGGAIARPMDTAVALARLTPSGRDEALRQAADLPGALGRAVRAALGGDDDLAGLPGVVVRVIGWLRTEAPDDPPYLFGSTDPDDAPRMSSEELANEVNKQPPRVTVDADGVHTMDWSHLPIYHEMRAAYAYEQSAGYAPDWAAALWPGDHRWLWQDDVTAVPALRLLLDPDEPVPPQALVAAIRRIGGRSPEQRALAADIVIQTIGDGRITSVELAHALQTIDEREPTVSGPRLVTLLQQTAAASALHRATVRAALIAVLPAWLSRPLAGRQKYGSLALLEELCVVDGMAVTDPQTRSHLGSLATGRSKTATLARRLLDRDPTAATRHPEAGTWPAEALAIALNVRIERADG